MSNQEDPRKEEAAPAAPAFKPEDFMIDPWGEIWHESGVPAWVVGDEDLDAWLALPATRQAIMAVA
jgi:hypothetical protein